ncbi:MAG: hypothetical protein RBR50_07410 [Candidatus Izemoplasmatales bacterium]|nr:hypothetical protein [Candidatus Izemoplasmatales bacterium]
MIKSNRPRIYSKYEINYIVFLYTMVLFVPLILVFTYVFNIEYTFDLNILLLALLAIDVFITLIGVIFLRIKRDTLKRNVKINYQNEFYYLVIISVFGLLGFIVLYQYFFGITEYIPSIFVLLLVIFVYTLIKLGQKYFNLRYQRKI